MNQFVLMKLIDYRGDTIGAKLVRQLQDAIAVLSAIVAVADEYVRWARLIWLRGAYRAIRVLHVRQSTRSGVSCEAGNASRTKEGR